MEETTMARSRARRLILLAVPLAGLAFSGSLRGDGAKSDAVSVSLCDGESTLTLSDVKAGETPSPERARQAASDMMQMWRKSQGEVRWASWVAEVAAVAAAATPQAAPPTAEPGQSTKFTARDQQLWKREQDKWIAEGYKNFHDAQALGGTIAVSCDMCHPNASNTHPETYPKYQVQLKKVALLRDMINWCIENPLKGKPLSEDDPRLRSVEAYILSQRQGVGLEPGKH
jgi:thiosulfate dehydrogenase